MAHNFKLALKKLDKKWVQFSEAEKPKTTSQRESNRSKDAARDPAQAEGEGEPRGEILSHNPELEPP